MFCIVFDLAMVVISSRLARVCLKTHSRHLQAPLCGRSGPLSVSVARYAFLIWARSSTNCDLQLT